MSSLLIAARHPLFIIVLVAAVFAGLTAHLWLLPLGVVVYLVSVVIASRDSALLSKVADRERRKGLTNQTFLNKINRIEHARTEVERSLKRASGIIRERLSQTVTPQTRHLVEQAYTLARKGQEIEHYLMRVSPQELQRQIDAIDTRIDRTTDDYTIDQLQGTRKALVEQRNSLQALSTYSGRITSQLDNIAANLEAMPAQILRMRASDVDSTMASEEVARHLSDMNADMDAFVSVLDSALGQTRTL